MQSNLYRFCTQRQLPVSCARCFKLIFPSLNPVFSFTGQRPASYCHGVVSVVRPLVHLSVCSSVHVCMRPFVNSSFQKTFPQKLLTGFLQNFTGMFLRWSSFKFIQIIVFHEEFWLPWQSK